MQRNPWFWILLAALGFGIGFPLTKWLLDNGVDVWQTFLPRYLIGSAVIYAILVTRRPIRMEITKGGLLGLVNLAIPTILLTIATDLLPASVVGVLVALIPTATVAAAHFVVPGETFAANLLPGLALAAAGVAVLVLGGQGSIEGGAGPLGVGITLAGVACAGAGGALTRRFASTTGALGLAIPQFFAATLAVSAIAIPLGGADFSSLSMPLWAGLVGIGLFSTALPFFAILKASELTTAAKTSVIGYLVPVFGASSSIVVLGEPITGALMVGGLLVGVGVYLTERAGRSEKPAPSLA